MSFTSRVGKHSAALQRALVEGKTMDVEVVMQRSGGVFKLKLKAAIVSNYTSSGEDESWVLNFQAIEQEKKAEGSAEGG
jgi:type VI protein secretion system component Hcp